MQKKTTATAEEERLRQQREAVIAPWFKWGPYVAERAWGTVREDYSADANAWNYFPYAKAASKAYRWGEDAIAGWCDRYQVLVLSPALWNGKDPLLKERLFGLTLFEGNHGEDVKEYYYHLDGLPSHAYMKYLYKYPQGEFPYQKLYEENGKRQPHDPEYELLDTGIFQENRYFDIFIEYAKDTEESVCIKIEAFNRSKEDASLDILMQMLFRNQWSWEDKPMQRPFILQEGDNCLVTDENQMPPPPHLPVAEYALGKRRLYGPEGASLLFTENETRFSEDWGYYKDAFHRKIIQKQPATNPLNKGSKAALHYHFDKIEAGKSATLLFRFTNEALKEPLKDVEEIIEKRKKEADLFYETLYPVNATEEEKLIQRQALAGMTWTKQIYIYDVNQWIKGDSAKYPPPQNRLNGRNSHWRHLNSMRIMLMPDKWEYPWFAAWDHAFHCITYSLLDMKFAKDQLWLLLFDQFQHPNGQIPAYEWDFSDLNPPVHAWAALRLYNMEKERYGTADKDFLEKCFHKLLLNFTWWVNKVDSVGHNVFEGGFLGLDNITVLDRSEKLPDGAILQQSDGTGWMAMFSLNLMRIALELSKSNKVYEGLATKFFQHYIYIAHAMKKRGSKDYEMWSDKDGFFYDVLTYPDGSFTKFRVRSLVGLIPLFATELLHEEEIKEHKEFFQNFKWFMNNRQDLVQSCVMKTNKRGQTHYILTPMNSAQLQSVLRYVWGSEEFRAEFGLRSMSRFHEKNPFVFKNKQVGYEPAESLDRVKGGNSNWRGPIWMPTTFLLLDALRKLTDAFEEDIKVASQNEPAVTLDAMAHSFASRIIKIFCKDASGKRPVFGPEFAFHEDIHWKDYLPFYEYYHPETGKGLGASHQTGWSALVANLIDEFR